MKHRVLSILCAACLTFTGAFTLSPASPATYAEEIAPYNNQTTTTASSINHGNESLPFTKVDNNLKWAVNPSGASKLIFTIKTNSSDTEVNGAFEINYKMEEWSAKASEGISTISCDVPSNANQVYFTVWWPASATLESVNPIYNDITTTTHNNTMTTTSTTNTAGSQLPIVKLSLDRITAKAGDTNVSFRCNIDLIGGDNPEPTLAFGISYQYNKLFEAIPKQHYDMLY